MPNEPLPRPFGNYLLTAALGEDALGRVYRAIRLSEERVFVRLRILDSPEIANDALLDAIEENGEIHGFLKNPAIARGVDMDAVEGTPYIAWNESSGRTLEALLEKTRALSRKIPVEHALLIAEKIATALDHAYNTTIDGDRTLHGLVWPGFVAISDDGEIRLAGFGLAPGILPSLDRPRLAREIAPYLAPEERGTAAIGKNSDVFSAGVILLELLTGLPPTGNPLATLKGAGGVLPPPILPEIMAVLRMTLGPAESRYKSSGDLRRELGKLLFSGPYSPSTFNLAFFLNDLFREEIEVEGRARAREAALEAGPASEAGRPAAPSRPPTAPPIPMRAEPGQSSAPLLLPRSHASRRSAIPLIGSLVVTAAIVGGIFVISRRPRDASAPALPTPAATPLASILTPTLLPELEATPSGPTNAMSEAQFRDKVSKRLAVEVQKLEAEIRSKKPPPPAPAPAAIEVAPVEPSPVRAEPTAAPTVAPAEAPPATVAPDPTRAVVREGALVPFEEVDSPPKIARIVKPSYPAIALQARIGGIVVLRVLVSEKGAPLEVEVLRPARAGLTEAAVEAVHRWIFQPATKAGVAVRTWMVVPIPFEP